MKVTLKNEFIPIAGLGAILLTLIALDVQGLPNPLAILRLILGLFFVLFVPGYALQSALFIDTEELDEIERIALSFGLSIALIPPIALILDALPWGIRREPIIISEIVCTTIFGLVTLFRRRRIPREERFIVSFEITPQAWWAEQDRTNRVLYTVLAIAFTVALLSALAIIIIPGPGERFTEFYVLGSEGLAENYLREIALGETAMVTIGVTNREGKSATYRIEVRNDDQLIGELAPFHLESGETREMPIVYQPIETGEDVRIDFYLYRDDRVEPYRTLRLWMEVTPSND